MMIRTVLWSKNSLPRPVVRRVALLSALAVGLVACDDSSSAKSSASTKVSAEAKRRPPPPKPAETKPAEKKSMELSDSDFLESETNRDPFRPYLKEFLTRPEQVAKIQRKVLLQRYGLDELQLIAVVAGRTNPRAMFRDPSGLGVTVKRGDYISKSAGRVKQIMRDKVVVEIQERLEDGQTVADRVIDLHPSGAQEP